MFSNKGELRRESECASASGTKIQMVQCDHLRSDDVWELRPSSGSAQSQLWSKRTGKCLTVENQGDKYLPSLVTCNEDSLEQKWIFEKYDTQFNTIQHGEDDDR